jgi:hypothetical protein
MLSSYFPVALSPFQPAGNVASCVSSPRLFMLNVYWLLFMVTYWKRDSKSLHVNRAHPFPLSFEMSDLRFSVNLLRTRGGTINTVIELRAGRPGFDSRQGQWFFFFATVSRPSLGPTQPSVKWVLGAFSAGGGVLKRPGRDHFHLVPRLRMRGAIPPLPYTSSWRGR